MKKKENVVGITTAIISCIIMVLIFFSYSHMNNGNANSSKDPIRLQEHLDESSPGRYKVNLINENDIQRAYLVEDTKNNTTSYIIFKRHDLMRWDMDHVIYVGKNWEEEERLVSK